MIINSFNSHGILCPIIEVVATLLWPSVGGEAQHLEKVRIGSPSGLLNV